MTEPRPTRKEPFDWWSEDPRVQSDEAAMNDFEGVEGESAPRPALEDELGDDEIRRTSEELERDEG